MTQIINKSQIKRAIAILLIGLFMLSLATPSLAMRRGDDLPNGGSSPSRTFRIQLAAGFIQAALQIANLGLGDIPDILAQLAHGAPALQPPQAQQLLPGPQAQRVQDLDANDDDPVEDEEEQEVVGLITPVGCTRAPAHRDAQAPGALVITPMSKRGHRYALYIVTTRRLQSDKFNCRNIASVGEFWESIRELPIYQELGQIVEQDLFRYIGQARCPYKRFTSHAREERNGSMSRLKRTLRRLAGSLQTADGRILPPQNAFFTVWAYGINESLLDALEAAAIHEFDCNTGNGLNSNPGPLSRLIAQGAVIVISNDGEELVLEEDEDGDDFLEEECRSLKRSKGPSDEDDSSEGGGPSGFISRAPMIGFTGSSTQSLEGH